MKILDFTSMKEEIDKVKEVLVLVLEASPHKPLTPSQIRNRVKVLDIVQENLKPEAPSFLLEDADHKLLKDAVNDFPYTKASHTLASLFDIVDKAKEHKMLKVVPKAVETAAEDKDVVNDAPSEEPKSA